MKKLLALLCLPALLLACSPTIDQVTSPGTAEAVGSVIDATGAQAPAPLNDTALDDQALNIALTGADTIATVVDQLVAIRQIVPGTPRALAVQSGLRRLRSFLVAASAAQRAGNATSYREALRNAAVAGREIQAAVRQ